MWEIKWIQLVTKWKRASESHIWNPVLSYLSVDTTGWLPTHLTLFLSLSVSVSLISQCIRRKKNPSFDSSFPIIPRLPHAPQLYPHEEYVITGESRPDRWLCVKPQCSPGRVILTRGHYQINNPLFFRIWASAQSPTGLLLSLSLFSSLPLCFPPVSQTCQVTCHCPDGCKLQSPLQEKDGYRRSEVRNLWRKRQMKV